MAETPKGGSGRNAIALSGDGGRVEPGGPERAGRQDTQHGRTAGTNGAGSAVDGSRRRPMIASLLREHRRFEGTDRVCIRRQIKVSDIEINVIAVRFAPRQLRECGSLAKLFGVTGDMTYEQGRDQAFVRRQRGE